MNALRPLLFLSLVSVSVLATCGGGSKEDPVALCKQGCSKTVELCASDLPGGLDPSAFKTLCEGICTSGANENQNCKNSSAIIAAYKMCLNKTTCDDLNTCSEGIPDCDTGGSTGTGGSSGTGTGGSSGTGGRSGTGGSSGTGGAGGAAGASCAALMTCCNTTTEPTLKTACTTYYTQVSGAGDAACAQALVVLKGQGACP